MRIPRHRDPNEAICKHCGKPIEYSENVWKEWLHINPLMRYCADGQNVAQPEETK